jgi:hypothetical protein
MAQNTYFFVVESGIYHLLIEQVSTVTSEFLQYRVRIQIELNRTDIKRVVKRTDLFINLFITIHHDQENIKHLGIG